jgi:nitrous oxide reductase accessory protein NosL
MTKNLSTVLIVFIFVTVCAVPSYSEPVHCTECGMMVDLNSKFSARLVKKDTTNYFCDIGDMFSYINRKGAPDAKLEVKDHATGDWIDANKAFYVRSEKLFKTPMGWGIASFKDRNEALKSGIVLDFDGMTKAIK